MQRNQHTVETFAAQHEDSQDAQRPQESTERGVVPNQRDVQTATFEEHSAHVSHTIRAYVQVQATAEITRGNNNGGLSVVVFERKTHTRILLSSMTKKNAYSN